MKYEAPKMIELGEAHTLTLARLWGFYDDWLGMASKFPGQG